MNIRQIIGIFRIKIIKILRSLGVYGHNEKFNYNINEFNSEIIEGENKMAETKTKAKTKALELEIENKSNRLVKIIKIHLENQDVSTIYLLKVAEIDIRLFIDVNEAHRIYRYMKRIVREVILKGNAKIEVKELNTQKNTYYLLKIANRNVKIYTGKEESQRVANYMTNVVNAIVKKIN